MVVAGGAATVLPTASATATAAAAVRFAAVVALGGKVDTLEKSFSD